MDASVTLTGRRGRPPADVAGAMNGPTYTQGKRYCVDALRLARAVGNGVAKAYSQRRNPETKSRADATRSSVADGVDAAISRWAAGDYNCVLGQESQWEEERLRAHLARGGEKEGYRAWAQFRPRVCVGEIKVFRPRRGGNDFKVVVGNDGWGRAPRGLFWGPNATRIRI